jgi:hypothetical protein
LPLGDAMKDLIETLQKLRVDAEDCDLISKLATDPAKRETFAKLALRLRQSAADIEQVIAERRAAGQP